MPMIIEKLQVGDNMTWLKDYFTVYVDLLILAIGSYILFIQGPNLFNEHMKREGQFLRIAGGVYLVIGVVGLAIALS